MQTTFFSIIIFDDPFTYLPKGCKKTTSPFDFTVHHESETRINKKEEREKRSEEAYEENIPGYLVCTVGNRLRGVPKLSFTWVGHISSYRWRHKEFLILSVTLVYSSLSHVRDKKQA